MNVDSRTFQFCSKHVSCPAYHRWMTLPADIYSFNKRPVSAGQYISLMPTTCCSALQPLSQEVRDQVHRSSIRPEPWIFFAFAPRSRCTVLENSPHQDTVPEFVHSSSVTPELPCRQDHSAIPLWKQSGPCLRWTFGNTWENLLSSSPSSKRGLLTELLYIDRHSNNIHTSYSLYPAPGLQKWSVSLGCVGVLKEGRYSRGPGE